MLEIDRGWHKDCRILTGVLSPSGHHEWEGRSDESVCGVRARMAGAVGSHLMNNTLGLHPLFKYWEKLQAGEDGVDSALVPKEH